MRLQTVVDDGLADGLSKQQITANLQEALGKMREILERGDIFW